MALEGIKRYNWVLENYRYHKPDFNKDSTQIAEYGEDFYHDENGIFVPGLKYGNIEAGLLTAIRGDVKIIEDEIREWKEIAIPECDDYNKCDDCPECPYYELGDSITFDLMKDGVTKMYAYIKVNGELNILLNDHDCEGLMFDKGIRKDGLTIVEQKIRDERLGITAPEMYLNHINGGAGLFNDNWFNLTMSELAITVFDHEDYSEFISLWNKKEQETLTKSLKYLITNPELNDGNYFLIDKIIQKSFDQFECNTLALKQDFSENSNALYMLIKSNTLNEYQKEHLAMKIVDLLTDNQEINQLVNTKDLYNIIQKTDLPEKIRLAMHKRGLRKLIMYNLNDQIIAQNNFESQVLINTAKRYLKASTSETSTFYSEMLLETAGVENPKDFIKEIINQGLRKILIDCPNCNESININLSINVKITDDHSYSSITKCSCCNEMINIDFKYGDVRNYRRLKNSRLAKSIKDAELIRCFMQDPLLAEMNETEETVNNNGTIDTGAQESFEPTSIDQIYDQIRNKDITPKDIIPLGIGAMLGIVYQYIRRRRIRRRTESIRELRQMFRN